MKQKRNIAVLASCFAVVVGMVGMSYAAVPLYYMFCRATGYGGTPNRADAAPGVTGDRVITVRFDTNVDPKLPWTFVPEQSSVQARIGEDKLVYFRAVNRSSSPSSGTPRSMSRRAGCALLQQDPVLLASPSSGSKPAKPSTCRSRSSSRPRS
jgi:cytochrome c oxidase assembly protein Cox11